MDQPPCFRLSVGAFRYSFQKPLPDKRNPNTEGVIHFKGRAMTFFLVATFLVLYMSEAVLNLEVAEIMVAKIR